MDKELFWSFFRKHFPMLYFPRISRRYRNLQIELEELDRELARQADAVENEGADPFNAIVKFCATVTPWADRISEDVIALKEANGCGNYGDLVRTMNMLAERLRSCGGRDHPVNITPCGDSVTEETVLLGNDAARIAGRSVRQWRNFEHEPPLSQEWAGGKNAYAIVKHMAHEKVIMWAAILHVTIHRANFVLTSSREPSPEKHSSASVIKFKNII